MNRDHRQSDPLTPRTVQERDLSCEGWIRGLTIDKSISRQFLLCSSHVRERRSPPRPVLPRFRFCTAGRSRCETISILEICHLVESEQTYNCRDPPQHEDCLQAISEWVDQWLQCPTFFDLWRRKSQFYLFFHLFNPTPHLCS